MRMKSVNVIVSEGVVSGYKIKPMFVWGELSAWMCQCISEVFKKAPFS